ncbi:MAG: O-antigen ligase family protein [Bacteroidota bacterium]
MQLETRFVRLGEAAITIGFIGCLFVAPMLLGGRHHAGRLVYAGFVVVASLGCLVAGRRVAIDRRSGPAAVICGLAVGAVLLQITPLPTQLLDALIPARNQLLPAWSTGDAAISGFGEWRTISMAPCSTRIGLAVLLAHVSLFWCAASAIRTADDAHRLLLAIGVAAACMACFGLMQYATSNGRLLWVYQHPHRDIGQWVQGAFINKNHFAHFVTLGVGPLLGAALSRHGVPARPGSTPPRVLSIVSRVAVVLVIAAVLLSLSRGAAVTLAACLAASGLMHWRAGALSGKRLLLTVATGAVLVAAALAVHGYRAVGDRLGDFTTGSLENLDASHGRRWIWAANLQAQAESPILGYGIGTHRDVYPAYFEQPFPTEFTHCESGYLHLATEAGWPAVLLALAAAVVTSWWFSSAWRPVNAPGRLVTLWAMLVPGLVASLLHSLVDFVWFVPSCFCLTLLLAAVAMRLSQLSVSTRPSTAPRQASAAGGSSKSVGLALLTASVAVSLLARPGWASLTWDAYLRHSVAIRDYERSRPIQERVDVGAHERMLLDHAIESLRATVARDPNCARAHARLAERLVERFYKSNASSTNPLGVDQISEAAIASEFSSLRATVGWLRRAFGDESLDLVEAYRHAETAVRLGPMQGQVYQLLADLRFLAPPERRALDELDRQALAARPHDGAVLLSAGRHRLAEGDAEGAFQYWREALQRPGRHRPMLLSLLCGRLSASDFLRAFQPDAATLLLMLQGYADAGTDVDRQALADYAVAQARDTSADLDDRYAAILWLNAGHAARRAGRVEIAIECGSEATALDSNFYSARALLALAHMEAEQFVKAEPHVRWCRSRRPDEPWVRNALMQLAKLRRQASGPPSHLR